MNKESDVGKKRKKKVDAKTLRISEEERHQCLCHNYDDVLINAKYLLGS